jgi:hypothetical protein
MIASVFFVKEPTSLPLKKTSKYISFKPIDSALGLVKTKVPFTLVNLFLILILVDDISFNTGFS